MASTPPLEVKVGSSLVGSGKLPVVSEGCGSSECFSQCIKEFFPDYVDYDWSNEELELDGETWDWSSDDELDVRSSNPIVIALQLDNGDDLLQALPLVESTGKPDLNAYSQFADLTVLQYAASLDRFKCVKALVDAGADLLVGLDDYGGTPLHYACRDPKPDLKANAEAERKKATSKTRPLIHRSSKTRSTKTLDAYKISGSND